ncbi:MAG: aryl-sulfate sulfotransferase [Coriobacteriales bacterium]|nr:aryl-sulfate sulfotransferase [Coriobacteriales bacterium]
MKRNLTTLLTATLVALVVLLGGCDSNPTQPATQDSTAAHQNASEPIVAEGLPAIHVEGSTDLPGNFYLSWVYTRDIAMLDGQGNIVWSKHEDQPAQGLKTGWWDFKKHVIDGKTYYSYHDQTGAYDNYGLNGFAPGERVILDENFNEVKRITFEKSDVVEKGDPLDGHDFLMIDLDHYILSGYIHETVYNVPGHEDGSKVVYSYLQEVDDGKVVWDWRSADYPELYGLTVTDGTPDAADYANEQTDAPDIMHFNAMRLDDEGNLVCSFRNLSTILCLDRTKDSDQILWKLSGAGDEFGLADYQKSSCQHYVTVDGNRVTVYDNGNKNQLSRIVTWEVDTKGKTVDTTDIHSFNHKFSKACGSAQRVDGDLYVVSFGAATKDNEYMAVIDFATGKKLLSITLDNPQDFTYRCVYFE